MSTWKDNWRDCFELISDEWIMRTSSDLTDNGSPAAKDLDTRLFEVVTSDNKIRTVITT